MANQFKFDNDVVDRAKWLYNSKTIETIDDCIFKAIKEFIPDDDLHAILSIFDITIFDLKEYYKSKIIVGTSGADV